MSISYVDSNLTKIADFIRQSKNSTDSILRSNMATEINNLPTLATSQITEDIEKAIAVEAITNLTYTGNTEINNGFYGENGIVEAYFPFVTQISGNFFMSSPSIFRVTFDSLTNLRATSFQNSSIRELIIKTNTVCTLYSSSIANSLKELKNLTIFVPENLVAQYKSASNWYLIADKIQAIS
jgi:hypothetical protein